MKILVVSKDAVERVSPGLWEKLDKETHPELGTLEKTLKGLKPVLLTKGGEGDVLIFHVSAKRRKLFYCDEVQPGAAEVSDKCFKALEETAGHTAVMLMRAEGPLPRITPHVHRCGG
ncbi:MAG: hypothetical protein V1787_01550 [Candidatus Micrarchaeota archaeon]